MMIYCFLFLGFSFVALIRDVSSCNSQCADRPVFTPSSLVVEFGHLASASCSVCQKDCLGNIFNIEKIVGNLTKNGTTVSWRVERLTEWNESPLCFYNTNNGPQCCTELPVTLYQPPQAVSLHFDGGPGHTGPMVEGQESTLVCWVHEVAPLGKMVVTFYRDQTPLDQKQYNSTEKKPLSDHFLFNITLSKEDDGVPYRCEAKLELGPEGPQPPPVVRSENVTANVIFKPQFMDQIHQVRVRVTRGESLQLNCSAVGNPRPSYTWTTPSNAPSSTKSSFLTINAVTSADAGQYTCSVRNHLGTVTKEFKVDVYVKPQFVDQIHQVPVTVTRGESLQLNCSAVGNPRPSYTWTTPSNAPSSIGTSFLTINAVTSADAGQYTCSVRNLLGTVTKEFNVDVYVKPQFMDQIHQVPVTVSRGESLQLNCSAVGNPRPSYTWTTPSNAPSSTNSSVLTINAVTSADAGQYTCSVRNLLGTVSKEFKVDVYNNTWWIILIVIGVIVLLVAIMVFICRYSKNHNGRYNLMEVFHLHQQRSSLSVDISR